MHTDHLLFFNSRRCICQWGPLPPFHRLSLDVVCLPADEEWQKLRSAPCGRASCILLVVLLCLIPIPPSNGHEHKCRKGHFLKCERGAYMAKIKFDKSWPAKTRLLLIFSGVFFSLSLSHAPTSHIWNITQPTCKVNYREEFTQLSENPLAAWILPLGKSAWWHLILLYAVHLWKRKWILRNGFPTLWGLISCLCHQFWFPMWTFPIVCSGRHTFTLKKTSAPYG